MYFTARVSFLCAISVLAIGVIECHPGGAPESVCKGLVPNHLVPSQAVPSPYVLVGHENSDSIELIIESPQNTPFRGFAIQAHLANGSNGAGVGKFVPKDSNIHTINCFGHQENTITHSDRSDKRRVSVVWVPPEDLAKGTAITFVGTVVKDKKTFWTNLTSEAIVISSHEDIKGHKPDDHNTDHQKGHHNDHKKKDITSGSLAMSLDCIFVILLTIFFIHRI